MSLVEEYIDPTTIWSDGLRGVWQVSILGIGSGHMAIIATIFSCFYNNNILLLL